MAGSDRVQLKSPRSVRAIGSKPKQRGTLARPRAGSDRPFQHPARPWRDPGHDRPGPAPGRGRGGRSDMKVHDLTAGSRVQEARQARRPWHRRQGRQDRRPRHEGPAGPQQGPRRLRGWPDAAPPAGAEAARASRTRSAWSTRPSTSTPSRHRASTRSRPRPCTNWAWLARSRWSRCWPGARSRVR